MVATAVCALSSWSWELPSVTSERSESDRVALPACNFATETLNCSSARSRLASCTFTKSVAASAAKKVCLVLSGGLVLGVDQPGVGGGFRWPWPSSCWRRAGSR